MPVQIHISGDNAAEALRELAGLAGPLSGTPVAVAQSQTREEAAPPKRSRSKPVEEKSAAEPETKDEAAPAEDVEPAEQEEAEPEQDDTPVPTDVELRSAASAAGKTAEQKAKIKALLTEFGATNVTAVPDAKRVAFKARLEAIANE